MVTLQFTGDWDRALGASVANGITETPDHRALLVVQTNTGLLFRVDRHTGVATQVDLGGITLPNRQTACSSRVGPCTSYRTAATRSPR